MKSHARVRPDRLNVASLRHAAALGIFAFATLSACAAPPSREPAASDAAAEATAEASPANERAARRLLEEARALSMQGRTAAAARATRRGLGFDPGNAALQRLRASLLEQLGRGAEAAEHRSRADALEPPLPPLPETPVGGIPDGELRVVLLPPPQLPAADRDRVPPRWPRGLVAQTLEQRLAVRLPEADVQHADPGDTDTAQQRLAAPAVQHVLTLRPARSLFATTRKDGAFGLSWLDWAAATRGPEPRTARGTVRVSIDGLRSDDARLESMARALEEVLASAEVRTALSTGKPRPPQDEAWSSPALAVVFPRIGENANAAISRGRALRRRGELEAARDAFAEAVRIAPANGYANALLVDSDADLAIARQLAGAVTGRIELAAQLSSQERSRLEARLLDARLERERLAASLSILAEHATAPSVGSIGALSAGSQLPPPPVLPDSPCGPEPFSGVVRSLHGPSADGSSHPVARLYFTAEPAPETLCLRADDLDEDGRMDRWTAYTSGVRSGAWEDSGGVTHPVEQWSRQVVYEADGSTPAVVTERSPAPPYSKRRRIDYQHGRVLREARDTSGDGRFDTFDEFSANELGAPRLVRRIEDRNGDGEIDVRSFYREGQLERREWLQK